MNLASDDPAVKKAAIINLAVEASTMVLSLALMTYAMKGEEFTLQLTRKLKRLRNKYFGPPPLTEEEIANQNRLLQIEAARILREAQ